MNLAWREKKALVWKRTGGVCEKCRTRRGAHVHHLQYHGRRGTEPLESLQLVCLECHGEYHPHHTFRTFAEQRQIAAAKKKQQAKCAHCGGLYSRERHNAICVKYGLHLHSTH